MCLLFSIAMCGIIFSSSALAAGNTCTSSSDCGPQEVCTDYQGTKYCASTTGKFCTSANASAVCGSGSVCSSNGLCEAAPTPSSPTPNANPSAQPSTNPSTAPATPSAQPSTGTPVTPTSGDKFGVSTLTGTNLINKTPNQFIVNIINAVTGLLAIVLIGMLVYGGALYITSAGNEQRVEAGKQTITYAIIGVVVVAAARIIAEFVIKSLTS